MKSFASISYLLALAASGASGAAIEKRQLQAGISFFQGLRATQKLPIRNPYSSTKLKPEYFPQAVRTRTVWGPFTLNPANGEHKNSARQLDKQSDLVEANLGGMCEDCMVLEARADITDKDGKRLGMIEKVYTHHITVTDQNRTSSMAPLLPGRSSSGTSSSCKGGKGGKGGMGGMMGGMGGMMSGPKGSNAQGHGGHMKRSPQGKGLGAIGGLMGGLKFSMFIAKGNEGDSSIFAPLNAKSPMKSGYWIGKGDQILGMAEAISYKDVPQEVYLTIDYEYVPVNGPRPAEYLDVSFGTIMVTDCGELNLHPTADKMVTYNSTGYTIGSDGYVVSLVPHLHDGGLNMKIVLNDKVVCESKAIYGQDGGTSVNGERWETITSYDPCIGPIKVKRNDKLLISSDYDLRKHKLRPSSAGDGGEAEAMAIALLQFAKAK